MNVELLSMAQLGVAARYFARTGVQPDGLPQDERIGQMLFRFAPRGERPETVVSGREAWLQALAERGMEDMLLLMQDSVEDIGALAQFNRLPCVLLCFYADGVTRWNRLWSYQPETGKWVVILQESPIDRPPEEKPRFSDVSQDMATLLAQIRALAQKRECSRFAFAFGAALKSLQADFVRGGEMPTVNRRLMKAATDAYVFGGEGSWNDVGQKAAQAKGMTEEYERLTQALFRGIALCMMYAVNEW